MKNFYRRFVQPIIWPRQIVHLTKKRCLKMFIPLKIYKVIDNRRRNAILLNVGCLRQGREAYVFSSGGCSADGTSQQQFRG